jgi:NRAMP (natural resistance-associated macrophage protein)-like metal ion transporter
VGAATGYRLLWSAPVLLPLAFAVQEACARIALVTGHGLAGVIKARMPRPILYLCLALVVVANTVNIAADLGSMAAALQLLVPVPQFLGVILFAAVIVVAEVFVPYHRYAKFLRWLCLSLLAYFAVMFVAKVDWAQVGHDLLVPQFEWTKGDIALLIAIAGTTISPYLFFWQSAEEVEERRITTHYRVSKAHIQAMRGDVFAGMATGVFAMAAIMITAAATLHKNGITDIQTAEQAAQALVPIAGDYAGVLFLLGILGTGLLSVPVLAGASSYAMAETFGWRESLEKRPSQARAFYAVIFLSILVGLTLNLLGLNPMQFLLIAAITNGLAAPILMAVIWWIASDEKLLGKWKSPLWSRVLLGIATIAMALLPLLWVLAP